MRAVRLLFFLFRTLPGCHAVLRAVGGCLTPAILPKPSRSFKQLQQAYHHSEPDPRSDHSSLQPRTLHVAGCRRPCSAVQIAVRDVDQSHAPNTVWEHLGLGQRFEYRTLATVIGRIFGPPWFRSIPIRIRLRQLDTNTQATIRTNTQLRSCPGHDDPVRLPPSARFVHIPSHSINKSQISKGDSYSNDPTSNRDGGSCQGQCRELNSAALASKTPSVALGGHSAADGAQNRPSDAQNRTMNQTIYFLQNFTRHDVQKINNGVSQSMRTFPSAPRTT